MGAGLAEAHGCHFPSEEDLAWGVPNCKAESTKVSTKVQIPRKGNLQKSSGKLRSQSLSPFFFFLSSFCLSTFYDKCLGLCSLCQFSAGQEGEGGTHFFVSFRICLSCLMSSYLIHSGPLIWAGGCLKKEWWFTGKQDIHRGASCPVQQN